MELISPSFGSAFGGGVQQSDAEVASYLSKNTALVMNPCHKSQVENVSNKNKKNIINVPIPISNVASPTLTQRP